MLGTFFRAMGRGEAASVDIVLDDPRAMPGTILSGHGTIRAGSRARTLGETLLELVTTAQIETGNGHQPGEIVLGHTALPPVDLGAGEEIDFTFQIDVPADAPLSIGGTASVLRSRISVSPGRDCERRDHVEIVATPAMAGVFEAADLLGLHLESVELEYNPRRNFPFVQEFDFAAGHSGLPVKEVEISLRPTETSVQVCLTVDRRRGLFGARGERGARFTPGEGELEPAVLAQILRARIEQLA